MQWDEQPARVAVSLGEALRLVGEDGEAKQLVEGAVQRLHILGLDQESSDLLALQIRGIRELADVMARGGSTRPLTTWKRGRASRARRPLESTHTCGGCSSIG